MMKLFNPLGMPLDEYVATHLREIGVVLALVVILLCALPFVELPGGTALAGRVTSRGKPVVFGTVTVLSSDHRTFTVPIRPDGTYVVKGVPPGPVQIAVSSPNPQPIGARQTAEKEAVRKVDQERPSGPTPQRAGGGQRSGRPDAGSGKDVAGVSIAATSERGPAVAEPGRGRVSDEGWFRIPGRYASPTTSGIGTELRRGRTTLDLSLD